MNRVYLHTTALTRALPLALMLAASAALANPQGGVVAEGAASIVENGANLNIYQQTDRAVIDWRSFNIDVGEHTRFYQPSANAVALNRVRSADPSVIAGRLSANGNVVLINPNGVFFTRDASVDVNRLIVTTADIANRDFMEGRMQFNQPGRPDAVIRNDGLITAGEAGLVGLVAPNVENNGIIRAKRVQLASADTMALDLYGDGLLGVAVSDAVTSQLVRNTGVIDAAGGTVELTAAAGRQVVNSLIDVQGEIKAPAVSQKGGKIIIAAQGTHGAAGRGHSTVKVNGALDVSGAQAGQEGGRIEITGDDIAIGAQAVLDASGHTASTQKTAEEESLEDMAARTEGRAGGDIYIGGGFQGDGSLIASLRTIIEKGAALSVRGTQQGDGGRAVVWSDGSTGFEGSIDARGGDVSGDGGLVEVSGAGHLNYNGHVDASAANGIYGQFLLDPTDIIISSAANNAVTAATPFEANADDAASNLNVTTLQSALASANVTVRTRATGTQQGNITINDPIAWSANRSLTLDAHNNITVNASITARNALNFIAGGDVILNANLIEHASGAALSFQPKTVSNTIGVAGGAGILNLSTADLSRIQNGWNSLTIGVASGTGVMDVGAYTWNVPTVLTSRTGQIQINGAQASGANAFTITTRNLALNNTLTGTGTLTIRPEGNTTMGVGTGAAGTLSLDDGELAQIQNGWGALVFGLSSSTAAMNVNAYSWLDPVTFTTRTGLLSINGAQNMAGSNLTITTRSLALNNTLSGTGTLTIRPEGNTTMGVGTGAVGILQLSDAELAQIQNGWGNLVLGLSSSTAAMNVNAYTWQDNVTFTTNTGLLTIAGAQNVAANNLTVATGSLALNSTLTGTGTLTIRHSQTAGTMGIGTGATGALQLDDAELSQIQDGWGNLVFGLTSSTGAMNVNAYTWQDNVTLNTSTGLMTIAGAQDVGANNLTIATRNLTLNGALAGTGTLTIQPEGNTTMGVGSAVTGTLHLDDTERAQIQTSWADIIFGSTASTQAVNIAGHSWNSNMTFRSDSGVVTVAGPQSIGAHDLTLQTDSDVAINGALTGTGTLNIRANNNAAATYSVGAAGGNIALTNADLDFISDGWGLISLGTSAVSGTGAWTIAARNWLDNLAIYTDTGAITVNGAQNFGTNDFTITSRGNITFNALVDGTGTLNFIPETTATTVSAGGSGSNMNIVNTSVPNISENWNQIFIGRNNGTGNITFNGASTWKAPVYVLTNSGVVSASVAQNFLANDFTIQSANDVNFTAAVNGTGKLHFMPLNASSTVRVGATGSNQDITASTVTNIGSGWDEVLIGRADGTGIITVNAVNNWAASLRILSNTGAINISAVQNFGANDFTIETNANPAVTANITGNGTFALKAQNGSTAIGLGAIAGIDLTAAEIAFLANGWSNMIFGDAAATSNITMGTATWQNPVVARTQGVITVNGTQTSTENTATAFTLIGEAGGDIINNAGATAFSTAGARWLIYADTQGDLTQGALVQDFRRYGCSFTGGCAVGVSVPATGNGIVYGFTPTITVTGLSAVNKIYDGTTTATLDTSGVGFLGAIAGDVLSLDVSGATANFLDKNVGTGKTISVSGIVLAGLNMGYQVIQPGAVVADITAKALSIAGLTGDSRVYDGTTNASVSGLAGLVGAILGDDVTLTGGATASFADKDVGVGKALSITGYGLAGVDMGNYTLAQPVGVTADITKATLRVVADDAQMVQGTATPTITYRYETADLLGGDTLGTIGLAGAPVIVAPVNFAALTLGNYDLQVGAGTLTSTNYSFAELLPRGTLSVLASLPGSSTPLTDTLPASVMHVSQFSGAWQSHGEQNEDESGDGILNITQDSFGDNSREDTPLLKWHPALLRLLGIDAKTSI